jgi:hypothetical protein
LQIKSEDGRVDLLRSAAANDDGYFQILGLCGGSGIVVAQDADGGVGMVEVPGLGRAESRGIEIRTRAPGHLTGSVKTTTGRGVEGVAVHIFMASSPNVVFRSVLSLEDGQFDIGSVPEGDYFVIREWASGESAESADTLRTRRRTVHVRAGAVSGPVEFLVSSRDKSISGVVLSPEGLPQPFTAVSAFLDVGSRDPRRGRPAAMATTLPDGTFSLENLDEGHYSLMARHAGTSEGGLRQVPTGSREVRLSLQSTNALKGRVLDERGDPVWGARVDVVPPASGPNEGAAERSRRVQMRLALEDTVTDVDGAFSITGVPEGKFEVIGTSSEGRMGAVPVEVRPRETSDVLITLEDAVRVRGRLVDLASGAGIPRAEIEAGGLESSLALTDERGRFEIRVPRTGSVVLKAIHLDGNAVATEQWEFDLQDHATTKELGDIRLVKGGATEVGGVGLKCQPRNGIPVIARVLSASPGGEAGLLPGDVITSIDGLPAQGLGEVGVRRLLEGRLDSTVTLVVRKADNTAVRNIALKRRIVFYPEEQM